MTVYDYVFTIYMYVYIYKYIYIYGSFEIPRVTPLSEVEVITVRLYIYIYIYHNNKIRYMSAMRQSAQYLVGRVKYRLNEGVCYNRV